MSSSTRESPPTQSTSSTIISTPPDRISTDTGVSITIQYIILILIYFIVFRNIVCTYNLGIKLDLKQIAMKVRNAEYNPKVYYFHYRIIEIQCSHSKNKTTKSNSFSFRFWQINLYGNKK